MSGEFDFDRCRSVELGPTGLSGLVSGCGAVLLRTCLLSMRFLYISHDIPANLLSNCVLSGVGPTGGPDKLVGPLLALLIQDAPPLLFPQFFVIVLYSPAAACHVCFDIGFAPLTVVYIPKSSCQCSKKNSAT